MAKQSVPETVPAYVRLIRELSDGGEAAYPRPGDWEAHVRGVLSEQSQSSGPCLRLVACPVSQPDRSPKSSQAPVRTPHLRLVWSTP
jgi:hypothetical protein